MIQIPERFRFDPAILAAVRRTVDAVQPDIIQTHSVKSHAAIRAAGVFRERPWIAFHHGYTRPNVKMRMYNEVDRWSLRRASRVVTPTRAFIAELVDRGIGREAIVVVPNAVDLSMARRSESEVAGVRRSQVVLAVGRLSREKGHADLIRAIGLLKHSHPALRLRLVIAGIGPDRAALESLSDRVAPGHVCFLGHVHNAHRLYKDADLAVLPSHSEGSPNALLEAAAYGCPIVATAVGGVPEILTDRESGLIVPPHDAAALAAAIERLLVDRATATRYGECARAAVAARFQPENRALTLLNLYEELTLPRVVSPNASLVCAS